jgi:hypothetical protein
LWSGLWFFVPNSLHALDQFEQTRTIHQGNRLTLGEGFGLTVAEAQLAVDGSKGKYPEFKGNVKTVETRDFFPKVEESPKDQGFHYHQNAGTYMQIGEAMGKGMIELLKAKP